ncbi:MAG: DUF1987 domain-containing protein [Bacteroidia bacterium]|nr:DUF1987 domain-containing protein [Bacteroidia bacterium]
MDTSNVTQKMQTLEIKPTERTPWVIVDREFQLFYIAGNSFPDNVLEFYQPVLKWIDEYVNNPDPKMLFHFRFNYVNSSTKKLLQLIMTKLSKVHTSGKVVRVLWESKETDEDLVDMGREFALMYDFPVKVQESPAE